MMKNVKLQKIASRINLGIDRSKIAKPIAEFQTQHTSKGKCSQRFLVVFFRIHEFLFGEISPTLQITRIPFP